MLLSRILNITQADNGIVIVKDNNSYFFAKNIYYIPNKERVDLIVKQIAKKENVNEEIKAQNQLEWVQKMNNILNRAEEIVTNEIIYQ